MHSDRDRDEGRAAFGAQPPAARGGAYGERPSALRRFIGGSPGGVFLRLLLMSVLVGAFLAMLGLTPGGLFWHAYDSVQALAHLAATQLHDLGGWLVAGAVVVVPLWLVARLFAVSR